MAWPPFGIKLFFFQFDPFLPNYWPKLLAIWFKIVIFGLLSLEEKRSFPVKYFNIPTKGLKQFSSSSI